MGGEVGEGKWEISGWKEMVLGGEGEVMRVAQPL